MLAGALLVVAGLAFWALYVHESGSEKHSYTSGGNPPATVRLVAGHTYGIAIHGGVNRELQLGIVPNQLRCTAALPDGLTRGLALTAEQVGTKATDRIASFTSSVSGDVQVRCAVIGAVYIDNSVDASYDWSGLFLVLTSIALLIGLPLTLSALRRLSRDPSSPAENV